MSVTADASASPEDIFCLDGVTDPHPAYDRLREKGPVHLLVQPDGLEVWFVCRYEEAKAALADPRLAHHLSHAKPAMCRAGLELGEDRIAFGAAHMLHSDPPDHTRLRGMVNRAFTPARIQRLRPRIQQITDDLLATVARRREADLVESLSYPLPVLVICELLGVPAEDRATFRAWSEAALTPDYVKDPILTRHEGNVALRGYLAQLVDQTRQEMRTQSLAREGKLDLLHALLRARDEQGHLSEEEVVAMLYLLLIAGYESTVNFLGNTLLRLLLAPQDMERLRRSPELLRTAVDEALRLEGPVQRSTLRTAVEDIMIGGTLVPRGSIVSIGLAAANRDEARFSGADGFDPARTDNAHLAFGYGPHFCLGAPLARLEGEIVLGTLLRRFSELRLAVPPERLRWRRTFQRGLTSLPVLLTAA
ncbi:cytochrome P450 [Nonomuraea sp. NPDC049695]|uniref:cytochrome P450 family protein n=1 Tax=Nonomuraea sp. NPDC049695 TaxID=3154734 RepID=UPI0034473D1B